MKSNKKATAKEKKQKLASSSRQPTIHHFFGGKPVPYQATVTQFFKKQDEIQHATDSLPVPSTSEETDDKSSALADDMSTSLKIEVKNKLESDQLDSKSSSSTGVHNPFKKPDTSLGGERESSGSTFPRKSLSLKIRKRKHRTIVSPENENHKKECLSPPAKNPKAPKTEMTEYCADEIELLSMYGSTGEIQKSISLSDLAQYDKDLSEVSSAALVNRGSHSTDLQLKQSPPLLDGGSALSIDLSLKEKTQCLPKSPTFSPRISSLKCFSPLLEKDRNRSVQPLDSSIPLFSTPLGSTNTSTVGNVSTPNLPKRRALFSTANTMQPVSNSPGSRDVSTPATKTGDDEFGFDDDVNLSAFLDHSDLLSQWDSSLSSHSTSGLCRYFVLEKVSQMSFHKERPIPEIMLRLFDEKTNIEEICYLRDDWLTTNVEPGDIVQVNADYDTPNSCYTIDNSSQFSSIVVNPDCLISGTSVANSVTCVRRAVLAEKFKGQKTGSEAMLIGQLLHEVFQCILLKRKEVGSSLAGTELQDVVKQEMKDVLTSVETLDQLYCLEMSETAALETLTEQAPAIVEWCDKYMHGEPVEGKGNIEFKIPGNDGGNNSCIAVTDVLDIEENIWSPRYGLKGKVDVSLTIKERRKHNHLQEKSTETLRVPLELKTGKMFRKQGTIEHRAQVALYTLMLGDRYSTQPPGGLLYYIKGGYMQGLPSLPHEIRGLINARNHLSRYHSATGDCMSMPGLLKDKYTCKHCHCIKECMLYHSAIEHGDQTSSGIGDLFSEQVSHLSPSHLEFFTKWYTLIAQEEACSRAREGSPFWLSDPEDREKEGHCHANLIAKPADSSSPLKRQTQTFSTSTTSSHTGESLLSTNDRVVISRQDGTRWAISLGTVTKPLCAGEIEVLVDKVVPSDSSVLYRIDAAPSYGGGVMAGSLADFCSSDSERDHHLRSLIIDLHAPRFTPDPSVETSDKTHQIISSLNSSQRKAVAKVLKAKDYTLVLGMPGTGKTTTISSLVRVLVALGKSVLLTSYTHSAVDNILLKLKRDGIDFLRLGSLSRVHPSIQMYTPSHVCKDVNTVCDLEQAYLSTPVVATTCLGIKHSLFTRRSFDVCIVDEASQITLPVSLGPLRHASMFVLVGDHYQLPPLVQSQQAREGGMDVSLFRYLSEHHPSALVSLDQQYRMNREIMSLSNKLIYNNQLKCGTQEVAVGRLYLPHYDTHSLPTQDCGTCEILLSHQWLKEVVNPNKPVLFISTDQCPTAVESIAGDHVCNVFEADLVTNIIDTLLQFGLSGDRIGVITPMRYQQNLIHQKVKSRMKPSEDTPDPSVVEVNTIDKYQGRDKECIILSFVRSNSKGNTGSLLKDWRRINVALTRAKYKLILVGSYNTLRETPLLKCMLEHIVENGWLTHFSESTLDTLG